MFICLNTILALTNCLINIDEVINLKNITETYDYKPNYDL